MIRPARQSDMRRAFTLLELLVATAIFATLLGALYAVFFGGLRLRETAWEDFEAGVARDQVARILQGDLTHAVAPSGILSGALIGTSKESGNNRLDKLEFYATSGVINEKDPWGDIQKIEYFLADPIDTGADKGAMDISKTNAGENQDFVRRTTRNLLATTVTEEDVPDVKWRLLKNVTSLTLQYYDGQSWLDSWDSTTVENANPLAIRIRMDFATVENERPQAPLEIICEIAPQPRTAATGGNP